MDKCYGSFQGWQPAVFQDIPNDSGVRAHRYHLCIRKTTLILSYQQNASCVNSADSKVRIGHPQQIGDSISHFQE